MKNYKLEHTEGARTELHEKLGLTGAEVSINNLPAGASVPFVHSHKENEEIYIVTEGSGTFKIDEETIELKKGDAIKVSPNGKRQLFAKENSLTEYTENDAIID